MCGYTGFITLSGDSNCNLSLLRKMNARIKHRGPDDEGYVLFSDNKIAVSKVEQENNNLPYLTNTLEVIDNPKLALAHRRLSIIDLSNFGHQPMSDSSGRYWIVYNGEIFNYKQIRSVLEQKGIEFYSNTDTEVLLQAYIYYGRDVVSKLDGFFSFIIYDRQEDVLYGARDFTGVKPFYFLKNENLFAFGSEIKCFYDVPDVNWDLDSSAITDFLVHGKTEIGRETFYKNISQLLPGESLRYNLKNNQLSIQAHKPKTNNDVNLKELIERSVKNRLMSDVPIGFALSGGLDSTLLCSLAKRSLQESLSLFSSNSVGKYDESKWQEIAQNHLNGKWYKTEVDIIDFDPETLAYIQDSPLLAANNLAHLQMVQTVKDKGIKVMFNGQGADELFAGYPIYFAHYYLHANVKEKKELISHLSNSPLDLSELKKLVLKLRLRSVMPRNLYERLIVRRKSYSRFLNRKRSFNSKYIRQEHSGSLKKALTKDFFGQRLREMLHWEDRNTMWYGVESRNPFADDMALAQGALALSDSERIKDGFSKYYLRNTFKDVLPIEIAKRTDKKGFSMPDIEWNRGWEEKIKKSLTNDNLDAYVDRKAILSELKTLLASDDIIMHQFLFRVMSLSSFMNIDKRKSYEMA